MILIMSTLFFITSGKYLTKKTRCKRKKLGNLLWRIFGITKIHANEIIEMKQIKWLKWLVGQGWLGITLFKTLLCTKNCEQH